MTLSRFDYIAPTTVPAAVAALREPGSVALAGGHHLLTLLKRRETSAGRLVDLGGLRELRGIEPGGDGLRVGALTTLGELLADPRVRAAHGGGALDDAVSRLGDRQSRNRTTVGGQLACGRTGNDLVAALLVLGTTVHLTGVDGSRQRPLDDLLGAAAELALRPGELITAVTLEPARGPSAYVRMANRATLEAACGVAAEVSPGTGGSVVRCRLAAVGAMIRPGRLTGMEAAVVAGVGPDDLPPPPADVPFVADRTASADYRRHMTRVLAGRALVLALDRSP